MSIAYSNSNILHQPPTAGRAPSRAFGQTLAPELDFLLGIAAPPAESIARERAERLLHESFNWQALTELAIRHGLSPIVYARLIPLLPRPWPDALSMLQADALLSTQRSLILETEMKQLVPLLGAKGIETIVLKGPALARTLYGGLAFRSFIDLDILVHPDQVIPAWRMLAERGYTLSYKISPAHLPALVASGNHLPLYGSPNNELIELHWKFFARARATVFDTAGAWERREPLYPDDPQVMTLAPHDLIHFLCLHGNKHAWGRLNWIADLVWFQHRYPSFDWDALVEHAARLGTCRMTLVGLVLAHELFEMPLPLGVTRRIEADPEVMPLARWMWNRVLSGAAGLPTGKELVQLVVRSRERHRDRARDLYHHLMAPRPDNLEAAPHSAALFHSYPIHRVLFLARKYATPFKR